MRFFLYTILPWAFLIFLLAIVLMAVLPKLLGVCQTFRQAREVRAQNKALLEARELLREVKEKAAADSYVDIALGDTDDKINKYLNKRKLNELE